MEDLIGWRVEVSRVVPGPGWHLGQSLDLGSTFRSEGDRTSPSSPAAVTVLAGVLQWVFLSAASFVSLLLFLKNLLLLICLVWNSRQSSMFEMYLK